MCSLGVSFCCVHREDLNSGRRMTLQKGGIPEGLKDAADWVVNLVRVACPSRTWLVNWGKVLGATDEGFQHFHRDDLYKDDENKKQP